MCFLFFLSLLPLYSFLRFPFFLLSLPPTLSDSSCVFCFEELRESFRLFDKDGDGKITAEEITKVLGSININIAEGDVKLMIREVDSDGEIFAFSFPLPEVSKLCLACVLNKVGVKTFARPRFYRISS